MPGLEKCLQEAMAIPGAIGASIVDYTTGFPVATTGAAPNGDHEAAAAGTADVVQAAQSRSLFVSAVPHDLLEDLIITTAGAITCCGSSGPISTAGWCSTSGWTGCAATSPWPGAACRASPRSSWRADDPYRSGWKERR